MLMHLKQSSNKRFYLLAERFKSSLPLSSRKGFGTLEVVIIIAVLLTIALIFRKTLSEYASNLINAVFDQSIIDNMGDYSLN